MMSGDELPATNWRVRRTFSDGTDCFWVQYSQLCVAEQFDESAADRNLSWASADATRLRSATGREPHIYAAGFPCLHEDT